MRLCGTKRGRVQRNVARETDACVGLGHGHRQKLSGSGGAEVHRVGGCSLAVQVGERFVNIRRRAVIAQLRLNAELGHVHAGIQSQGLRGDSGWGGDLKSVALSAREQAGGCVSGGRERRAVRPGEADRIVAIGIQRKVTDRLSRRSTGPRCPSSDWAGSRGSGPIRSSRRFPSDVRFRVLPGVNGVPLR